MTETQMVEIIVGIVIFLGSFIRIPKLELNVWGIIGNELKKGMLKEIDGKIDAISTKVNALSAQVEAVNQHVVAVEEKEEENEAVNCRTRILRFGDEIAHEMEHSKEHFDQILSDIDEYEKYCHAHPNFKNNRTKETNQVILGAYRKRFEKHDFA